MGGHRSLRSAALWRFLVAATLPLLIVGLLARSYVAKRQTEAIEARNLQLAHALANHVREFLGSASAQLHQTARIVSFHGSGEAEELDLVLGSLVRDTPGAPMFEAVYLLDERGVVERLALAEGLRGREESHRDLDLSGHEFFAQLRAGRDLVWSDAQRSLLSDRLTVRLALRLGARTLVGDFGVEGLSRLAVSPDPELDLEIVLVDAKGAVFLHPDPDVTDQRVNVRTFAPVAEGLVGREGTRRYEAQGRARLGSVAVIPETGWLVLVSQDEVTALAPVRHLERVSLGGLAAGILLAAIGAVWLASRLTRPLLRLSDGAHAIAGGRYDTEIPRQPFVEMEGLAASLREMVAAVGRREKALRASERRLRSTFDQAAMGIVNADLDGSFQRVNQRFCDIVGYSREEILGRTFQDVTHPDDLEADLRHVQDLLAGRIDTFTIEKRYVRKDGRSVWVSLTVSLERREDGTPEQLIGVVADVGARKRMEAEKSELEAQLQHSQKLEAIGQLAGGIAHDFNNQLTVIQGCSELLLARLEPDDPKRKQLEDILRASERSRELTSQLLAFGRKQVLRPEVLRLDRVLEELRGPLARMVGEDVEITLESDGECDAVKLDRGRFEQAIINLAVNARDAMPQGGDLRLETGEVELGPRGARQLELPAGRYVAVTVSDTGTGMSADVLQQVFEPFFTTKEVGKGTGLGLSMVYGFVHQSLGAITVESEPGFGAIFRLYFPPTREAVEERPAEPKRPPAKGGQETILVAEDEEAVREVVVQSLDLRGYAVVESKDAAHAIELAGSHEGPIELLITDVVMPGMSGPLLADRVTEIRPETRVLFITGYTKDDLDRRSGGKRASNHVLPKPFSPDELARAVRRILDDGHPAG